VELSKLSRQVPTYTAAYDAAEKLVRELEEIADVDRGSAPLAALKVARDVASQLSGQVTAELVRSARRDGASWADVGASLGISKQAAQQRFSAAERWDGISARCQVASRELAGDTDLCEGPMDAVWVLGSNETPSEEQKRTFGLLGCVHHGAKLYARIGTHARVYPNGDEHGNAALEVYHRAQGIKPKAAAG
jgi:hypothetical protein